MEKLILVARPCEMSTLIRWVLDEYYSDIPIDCPHVEDTIRKKITTVLQAYFVRDHDAGETLLDNTINEILRLIDEELRVLITTLTRKGFNIEAVDTFSLDGSTRFILTLTGEHHVQPLPVPDTG